MISQFIVLSLRGDTIVSRDYRYDVPTGSAETFFRTLKFGVHGDGEEAPPVFHVDGVNYFHLKVRRSLSLVRSARASPNPWTVRSRSLHPRSAPAVEQTPSGCVAACQWPGDGVLLAGFTAMKDQEDRPSLAVVRCRHTMDTPVFSPAIVNQHSHPAGRLRPSPGRVVRRMRMSLARVCPTVPEPCGNC